MGSLPDMRQNEPEVVLLPEKDKRLTAAIREKSTEGRSTFLQAYPNPSSGPVYLTYSVVEGVENASLEVYTEQGQLAMSKTLGNSNIEHPTPGTRHPCSSALFRWSACGHRQG